MIDKLSEIQNAITTKLEELHEQLELATLLEKYGADNYYKSITLLELDRCTKDLEEFGDCLVDDPIECVIRYSDYLVYNKDIAKWTTI